MSYQEPAVALLFCLLLVFFAWGRFRHDLVAFAGLMMAVLIGIVPADEAFSGFGHPAVISVAAMLVLTRALGESGAIDPISSFVSRFSKTTMMHVGSLAGTASLLSTIMNNVGSLALLLPVALETSKKAARSPSLILMPISFAALLGGLVTLIGTPPNIIIANFRHDAVGESFGMFDYTFVGLPLAIIGVAFVSLIGWRLLPIRKPDSGTQDVLEVGDYVTEVQVPPKTKLLGISLGELGDRFASLDAAVLGLAREGRQFPNVPRRFLLREGDVLLIKVAPGNLQALLKRFGLSITGEEGGYARLLKGDQVEIGEFVVTPDSLLSGRNRTRERLAHQFNVNLLAVARQSSQIRDQLDRVILQGGDVLLLQGEEERQQEVVQLLGLLPLAGTKAPVARRDKAGTMTLIFAVAIMAVALNLVPLAISLGLAVIAVVGAQVLRLRDIYETIDWAVIVLLASMIPIGQALHEMGLVSRLADALVFLPGEGAVVTSFVLLFLLTMALTDLINNAATVVIMGPVAIQMAERLGVNIDTCLMGVAIAASCAFLTPIGHQNNTLIMGPGGYQFRDYWRLGLPLQLAITLAAIPLILWIWPLYE